MITFEKIESCCEILLAYGKGPPSGVPKAAKYSELQKAVVSVDLWRSETAVKS
jgi:hypothetical protein